MFEFYPGWAEKSTTGTTELLKISATMDCQLAVRMEAGSHALGVLLAAAAVQSGRETL